MAALDPAIAARAVINTPVANTEMPTLDGSKARPLRGVEANVLVFFRPNHERSLNTLRELAQCQKAFSMEPVHWVAIVSSSAPAEAASTLVRESGFVAPVLVDTGDELYGNLGISLHPVTVITGRDHKLSAFEPFRSVDYCSIVSARIRHVMGKISDDELRQVLDPPKAAEGGNSQVARRYRALAEALFKVGNYDKALESARKSIEKDLQLAPAHALMGEILRAQGKCGEAITAFDKALTLDATNALAKEGIGRCMPAR